VTVQNFGGDKLDYWSHQHISHSCEISDSMASCRTSVRLRNSAPSGLPRYVTQKRPQATLKSFVEVYIPSGAGVTTVDVDGSYPPLSRQRENGYTAIGIYLKIPRGQSSVATIEYLIPIDGDYRLDVRPQPLARPGHVRLGAHQPR
jgi:hypothetical protein